MYGRFLSLLLLLGRASRGGPRLLLRRLPLQALMQQNLPGLHRCDVCRRRGGYWYLEGRPHRVYPAWFTAAPYSASGRSGCLWHIVWLCHRCTFSEWGCPSCAERDEAERVARLSADWLRFLATRGVARSGGL